MVFAAAGRCSASVSSPAQVISGPLRMPVRAACVGLLHLGCPGQPAAVNSPRLGAVATPMTALVATLLIVGERGGCGVGSCACPCPRAGPGRRGLFVCVCGGGDGGRSVPWVLFLS